jgi:putative Holliday junction resolvase
MDQAMDRARSATRPPGRLLAIDFGERRVGLALSDHDARFAVPYGTLRRTSDRDLLRRLRQIADEEQVDAVVLGEPRDPRGGEHPAKERIRRFAVALARTLERPVELVDESLTTVEAAARLREAGLDARRRPERLDALAAQVLLEEVLSRPPRCGREDADGGGPTP